MHSPGFLTNREWLTFGHVRPVHLNTVIYGWASMAGIGTTLWIEARLCRTASFSNVIAIHRDCLERRSYVRHHRHLWRL
jgi:cbb3-type cytochrome oxidase subunit 1